MLGHIIPCLLEFELLNLLAYIGAHAIEILTALRSRRTRCAQ